MSSWLLWFQETPALPEETVLTTVEDYQDYFSVLWLWKNAFTQEGRPKINKVFSPELCMLLRNVYVPQLLWLEDALLEAKAEELSKKQRVNVEVAYHCKLLGSMHGRDGTLSEKSDLLESSKRLDLAKQEYGQASSRRKYYKDRRDYEQDLRARIHFCVYMCDMVLCFELPNSRYSLFI